MNTYKRYRFPPEFISYAVWLYYRFNLSHGDIENLLAEQGITLSREAIRRDRPSVRYNVLKDFSLKTGRRWVVFTQLP
jgi:transposase-like protein